MSLYYNSDFVKHPISTIQLSILFNVPESDKLILSFFFYFLPNKMPIFYDGI